MCTVTNLLYTIIEEKMFGLSSNKESYKDLLEVVMFNMGCDSNTIKEKCLTSKDC